MQNPVRSTLHTNSSVIFVAGDTTPGLSLVSSYDKTAKLQRGKKNRTVQNRKEQNKTKQSGTEPHSAGMNGERKVETNATVSLAR